MIHSPVLDDGQIFSRFTDRARRVFAQANAEAVRRGEPVIMAHHIFAGLCKDTEAVGGRVLLENGITLDHVRLFVDEIHGPGRDDGLSQKLPLSDQAKATAARACEQALSLYHNYVGTAHVLLALTADQDGTDIARILGWAAVTPEKLHSDVLTLFQRTDLSGLDPDRQMMQMLQDISDRTRRIEDKLFRRSV